MYRTLDGVTEVLLVHPGGPYWAGKDAGAWSIPKGEYGGGEDPLGVAAREFREELGHEPPDVAGATALGEARQAGGKLVRVWAVAGDLDPSATTSNTFSMEWPPRSGRTATFPEVDRAAWFSLIEARSKLVRGQVPFLERLAEVLASTDG